jgi:hypothetical protein
VLAIRRRRGSTGRPSDRATRRLAPGERARLVELLGAGPLAERLRLQSGRGALEHQHRVAQLELVAVTEAEGAVLVAAVDHRPVAGAEVVQDVAAAVELDGQVLARHRDVGEHDVVVHAAPDRGAPAAQGEAPAAIGPGLHHQPRGAERRRAGLRLQRGPPSDRPLLLVRHHGQGRAAARALVLGRIVERGAAGLTGPGRQVIDEVQLAVGAGLQQDLGRVVLDGLGRRRLLVDVDLADHVLGRGGRARIVGGKRQRSDRRRPERCDDVRTRLAKRSLRIDGGLLVPLFVPLAGRPRLPAQRGRKHRAQRRRHRHRPEGLATASQG